MIICPAQITANALENYPEKINVRGFSSPPENDISELRRKLNDAIGMVGLGKMGGSYLRSFRASGAGH